VSKHSNSPIARRLRLTSITLSIGMIVIGISVIVGWLFDITFLKSVSSSYIPTKPNSAIAFIISSMALLLQYSQPDEQPLSMTITGKLIGAMLTIFALLTLIEHVSGYNFAIDQIFIQETSSYQIAFAPGRPTPFTTLIFMMIGLTLIMLDLRGLNFLVQILASLIGVAGLMVITGLTYNTSLYANSQLIPYIYASIQTSICFILFSLALLFMRCTEGFMVLFISDTSGGIVARRLIPIVVIIPLIFSYFRIAGEQHGLFDIVTGIALISILITAIYIFLIILTSTMLMRMDIKRKLTDEKLRKSYSEIEDLYNNAPCGYHSIDENAVFIHINSTELQWLGYSYDEVIGKKFTDFLTPNSLDHFHKNFRRFLKRGHVENIEFELVRKDGSIIYVLLNSTAIKNHEGKFIMSRSTLYDITDRKRTEQALRESEDRFHKAMDTAPIGMAIVSLKGVFIEVNQSLCQILGYSKDELEKMKFQDISNPEDLALDLEMRNLLIRGSIPSYHFEKRYMRKNGKPIWVQMTVSLLRDSVNNQPLYFITQIEDISERKVSEEKIRELAYHDTLTNLPNRRLLLDRLHHDISMARRHHHILAVMFLDLDKFKVINDRLGHDVGDELLKAVAIRLSSILRKEDTVARLSGDEFVIVLTELTNPDDASIVANKILHTIGNHFLIHGHDFSIGVSIGISIYPRDGLTAMALIKNADSAMYASKESGRNRFRYYQDTLKNPDS